MPHVKDFAVGSTQLYHRSTLAPALDRAKAVLRMYVNGTIGFIPLATQLGQSPKTLMRILSPRGNPQARTLFHLLAHLQRAEGIALIATEAPPMST